MPIKPIILLSVLAIVVGLSTSIAEARCGYYAGYGYRCFGDKGGTGGKAFKQMDENTKKCGYWNPGCQDHDRGNYRAPQSDKAYHPPKTQKR